MHTISAALCAAALTAAGPALAQHTTPREHARPVAITGATPTVVHPIITYRFNGWRGAATLPSEVTLADSAGTIVASYRTPRDSTPHPMEVYLSGGTDLLVIGETVKGPLTLSFHDPSLDASRGIGAGRWTLGDESGDLRLRVLRP